MPTIRFYRILAKQNCIIQYSETTHVWKRQCQTSTIHCQDVSPLDNTSMYDKNCCRSKKMLVKEFWRIQSDYLVSVNCERYRLSLSVDLLREALKKRIPRIKEKRRGVSGCVLTVHPGAKACANLLYKNLIWIDASKNMKLAPGVGLLL